MAGQNLGFLRSPPAPSLAHPISPPPIHSLLTPVLLIKWLLLCPPSPGNYLSKTPKMELWENDMIGTSDLGLRKEEE